MIARWEVEPLHRSRRGFDERLLIAAPWILRPVSWAAARASPGSLVRRALLGRALRVGNAAANRDGYDAIFPFLDPAFELHMYPDSPEARPAGMEPVYRGAEGFRKSLADWEAAFDENRWDLHEFIDGGGKRMGGRTELVGRGAGSGVETRMTQFMVWRFERGLIQHQSVFQSEAAMLALLTEA